MHPKKEITSLDATLAKEDWLTLSTILDKIDLSTIKNKKTRYKVVFIKGMIRSYLQTFNGHGTISISLLLGALKTLATLEKELGGQNENFLFFFRALVLKFKQQRLLANKALEKKLEFKKMKGVVES